MAGPPVTLFKKLTSCKEFLKRAGHTISKADSRGGRRKVVSICLLRPLLSVRNSPSSSPKRSGLRHMNVSMMLATKRQLEEADEQLSVAHDKEADPIR
jgi:hypothetical protein